MQPIWYSCDDALRHHWVEAAEREGFHLVSRTGKAVTLQYRDKEICVEIMDFEASDGEGLDYVLEFHGGQNQSLSRRLQRLLTASEAPCNPVLPILEETLYRCPIGTIPAWIELLRGKGIQVDYTVRALAALGNEFPEGKVRNSGGNKLRFFTGSAYDSERCIMCDWIEIGPVHILPRRGEKAFVAEVTGELESLQGVVEVSSSQWLVPDTGYTTCQVSKSKSHDA